MINETDHAYSERQRAILKIDDAIYMDAGQTAWLVQRNDDRTHYLWTLDEFVPETFQTSRGWYKVFQHVGNALFSVGGEELSMPLYGFTTEPSEITDISAFFTDAMSGIETYGVGRYLDVEMEAGSFPPATVTLDFNYAYNPLCARSSYDNCPYAEYDIAQPIRAGEMKPTDH